MTIAISQPQTDIVPAYVQINANNPESLAEFYHEQLGFSILFADESQDVYKLGTNTDRVLLEIYPATESLSKATAGLYHFAILLPERANLGTILRHILVHQIPLQGASDHGYSEAIYLQDPEGNGIEIYWDKPKMEWTIKENGEIPGITIEMDYEGVIALASENYKGLPSETTLGHFHISVNNLEKADNFYRGVLGLGNKFSAGNSAMFMASGDYHHHLGVNLWGGLNTAIREDGIQGLKSLTWYANPDDYTKIEASLAQHEISFKHAEDILEFKDDNGILNRIIKH